MAEQEEVATIIVADREILVRKLNENALMTLAQVGRSTHRPTTEEEKRRSANKLGRLGDIIESIMVNEEDREWMHDGLIWGNMTMETALEILRLTAKEFNQEEAPRTGPAKAVARRGRR